MIGHDNKNHDLCCASAGEKFWGEMDKEVGALRVARKSESFDRIELFLPIFTIILDLREIIILFPREFRPAFIHELDNIRDKQYPLPSPKRLSQFTFRFLDFGLINYGPFILFAP